MTTSASTSSARLPLRARSRRRAIVGVLLLFGAIACAGVLWARSASRSVVTIAEAPPDRWSDPDATFRVKSKAKEITCRRDEEPYRPCRRKVTYSGLPPGRHTFTVRARYAGRTAFARHRWTVARSARSPAPVPAPALDVAGFDRRPDAGAPDARRLIWADEFNGPTLDTSAWVAYDSPGNAGFGLRRPSAISLDGQGNLVITARMVDGQLVSGGIAHRTEFTYGRVEFRVRSEPDPTGTMSAVVLTWPQEQWSPEFTENDMYETGPRADNRSRFESFIHFGTAVDWQKWTTHEADPSQWHTIAMEWHPEQLDIYVDGRLSFSISDPAVIPDVLHHVTVQLDPRASHRLTRPVRMFVDYVRVYQ